MMELRHVVYFVTEYGCEIYINVGSAVAVLDLLARNRDKVTVQRTVALKTGANRIGAGIYHVRGSSAFHVKASSASNPGGDGVIIVHDAEDPEIPPLVKKLLGFTDAKELREALNLKPCVCK